MDRINPIYNPISNRTTKNSISLS